jgi:hypothetical protein
MRLDDGREKLLSFCLPLDVVVLSELIRGVGEAAKRLGYTDVHLVNDGVNRGAVIGTPPVHPVVLPHEWVSP